MDTKNPEKKQLSRRELLGRYGPYTAPIVVSILTPTKAYGDGGSSVYSETYNYGGSRRDCITDHGGRAYRRHCRGHT